MVVAVVEALVVVVAALNGNVRSIIAIVLADKARLAVVRKMLGQSQLFSVENKKVAAAVDPWRRLIDDVGG